MGGKQNTSHRLQPWLKSTSSPSILMKVSKMTNETKKIMEDDSIAVSATCTYPSFVSLPRVSSYWNKRSGTTDEVKAAIAEFPGAVLEDDVANQVYPQAVNAVGSRDTFVGRVRKDLMLKKVSTCGLFQIILLSCFGTQSKSQKHSRTWFVCLTSELKFDQIGERNRNQ